MPQVSPDSRSSGNMSAFPYITPSIEISYIRPSTRGPLQIIDVERSQSFELIDCFWWNKRTVFQQSIQWAVHVAEKLGWTRRHLAARCIEILHQLCSTPFRTPGKIKTWLPIATWWWLEASQMNRYQTSLRTHASLENTTTNCGRSALPIPGLQFFNALQSMGLLTVEQKLNLTHAINKLNS